MKHFPVVLLLLTVLQQIVFADFQRDVRLVVPWGKLPGQILLQETPGGWLGVSSFEVIGENTFLMPANSGQIMVFDGQSFQKPLQTYLTDAKDFQMGTAGTWRYIMNSKQIFANHGQKPENIWVNPWEMKPNSRIIRADANHPQVLINLSETVSVSDSPTSHAGVINRQGHYGQLHRQSGSAMVLTLDDRQLAVLHPDRGTWGSGQYLGSSDAGNHYILLEKILQTYPLKLFREIQVLTRAGQILGTIDIPATLHIPVTREFQLDGDGSLHEMITTPEGAVILSYHWKATGGDQVFHLALPAEYQIIQPRPFSGDSLLPGFPHYEEKSGMGGREIQLLDFPPVGRAEALSTADEYVALIWTANPENITNGQINDPDGHAVQTPDWVHLGQNQRMAYQWGGFSTVNGYVNGLANGKYAGDMATSAVSNYAVGVDCSGFVCRCWNMPQHYSTWMMSNTQPLITQPCNSWYDLAAGDAIHKVGHVRLMVLWNTNGTLLAVEAGGAWITDYHAYSISQLAAYQPRYYVYMEGQPATVEQPVLGSLQTGDSLRLNWSLADTAGVSGVRVYRKNIFSPDDWMLAVPNDVPVDQHAVVLLVSDSSFAYQLRSVSNGTAVESYPSDTYACARKEGPEKLLIVDGFDRTTGSYPFPSHDFALTMARALGHFTFSYETADNDAVINAEVNLSDYAAVFWLLGDESTVSETFSVTEQMHIRNYLIQGGRLFVSGSEVAWDLDAQGSSSDQAFCHNYLKNSLGADNAQSYTINGVSGTPFDGLTFDYDDGSHGVYPENFPDAFQVVGGSQAVLRYANNMIAATAYTGTFASSDIEGRVIVLGIPFETIYNPEKQLELTTAILGYFGLSTNLATHGRADLLPAAQLLMPYPNPFNTTAQIRFQLDHPSRVALQVFDLRGRLVQDLGSRDYPSGVWQVPFHAEGLAGGMYLVHMTTPVKQQSRKIIYLK